MSAHRPRSVEFREQREHQWRELEEILARIDKGGIHSVPPDELARLPRLYRATVSSLSLARAVSLDRNLLDYLESLAARAYIVVYARRIGFFEAIRRFFVAAFPRHVRMMRGHLLVSSGLLLAGILVAVALVQQDPNYFHTFVGEGMAGGRGPESSTETLRATLFGSTGDPADQLTLFASFLLSHNAKIGMMALALGVAFGLPIFYLLFFNGLSLGAFIALFHSRGLSVEFFSWILPHGITELLAVALCGAAGLYIGESIVFPGRHRRIDNLARRGKEAGIVGLGAIGLFFLAALIEGLFRQLVDDMVIRYALASATALFWVVYFGWVGRGRSA